MCRVTTPSNKPEIRWFGGYSPHKPPFGVRSCEVVIIHPESLQVVKKLEERDLHLGALQTKLVTSFGTVNQFPED